MRYLMFLSLIILFYACSINDKPKDPIVPSIKGTDRIDIAFYNNGDTLNFQTVDPKGFEILIGQISGDKATDKNSCNAIGELRYFVKEQLVYVAGFAIDTANKNGGCNFVSYDWQNNKYKHALSERAENMLQKIYASAKKS